MTSVSAAAESLRAVIRFINHWQAEQCARLTGEHDTIDGLHLLGKGLILTNHRLAARRAQSGDLYQRLPHYANGLPDCPKQRADIAGAFSSTSKADAAKPVRAMASSKVLPDVYVECDSCNGKRYNRETLEVKCKDRLHCRIVGMTV